MNLEKAIENGRTMVSQGSLGDAIDLYLNLIKDFPESERAHADLGTVYAMMQNHDSSIEALEMAIGLGAKDAATYSTLATVLSECGRAEEALSFFDMAVVADPSFVFAYYNLAGALESMKEFRRAVDALEKCLELSEPNTDFSQKVKSKKESLLKLIPS